jgi:LruC domain-containing protein
MIDRNGYPFGIVVPVDWAWPLERVNVNTVYPHFPGYRAWLLDNTLPISMMEKEWYRHPATDAAGKIFNRSLFTP